MKILVVILALLAAFAVFVAIQPAEYAVSRTATIPGSPATVFGMVNDFHEWEKWSPWGKLDPQMTTKYSGPASGAGAVYEWKGNADVGEGKMTITESNANEHIGIRLEFVAPFASVAQTDFHFKPAGEATEVTWSMSGKNGFVEKAFSLFMNMDAMIGADFEKGLNQLAAAVKALPAKEMETDSPPAVAAP
ncbi:MAG: SRPBCC family protein [Bryobacterales bacterium]|nr:SRPBCC family protein [Bryobacterales bacterium]